MVCFLFLCVCVCVHAPGSLLSDCPALVFVSVEGFIRVCVPMNVIDRMTVDRMVDLFFLVNLPIASGMYCRMSGCARES